MSETCFRNPFREGPLAMLSFFQIIILSVVQGLAELLPVSSSAHVIVAEKILGLDPSSPQMTFLLVMLHTGTMFAVIFYFRKRWLALFMQKSTHRNELIKMVVAATVATGIVGYGLKIIIERVFLAGGPKAEIEELFSNLTLISLALAAAGLVILATSFVGRKRRKKQGQLAAGVWVGVIQGLCLPFRGFSRSGATISTGLMLGMSKEFSEEFSFILAVILTPPVIGKELIRLLHAHRESGAAVHFGALLFPGLIGMVFSFLAGCLAIRWLSRWLENGKWHYFGVYCLVFSAVILVAIFFGGLS